MTTTTHTPTIPPARPAGKRLSLTQWILLATVLGSLLGWLFPEASQQLVVVSKIFLRLVKCIAVPIIFSTLVAGIAAHSDDLKSVGRLALRSLIYFEVVTTLALVIGLLAVNLLKPGVGVKLPPPDPSSPANNLVKLTTRERLENIAPESFFKSAAENDVLQVVVFAAIFAVALTQVQGEPKKAMLGFCEGLSQVMFKFTDLVMKLAPWGIGAAMAVTVGHLGLDVLKHLIKLILTLYSALTVFGLVVLLPAALIARVPVGRFLKAIKGPALIAFSTTSSEAALPSALEAMVKFGVPKRIVSFVLPAGYSFNLDGSTLHLAVALVFVAQAAGVSLTTGQQVMMMLTLMLTSKGVAAVPRATSVILSGALVSFGLPLEGVALILAVDAILDMARTTINVIGNCLASAIMASWEGELRVPAEVEVRPG